MQVGFLTLNRMRFRVVAKTSLYVHHVLLNGLK
jgi:hypothetical protein